MNNEQFEKLFELPRSSVGRRRHLRRRGCSQSRAQPRQRPVAAAKAAVLAPAPVLLDWQFAPAWPRMAALACCAALGFYVGIAGLDRRFDDPTPPLPLSAAAA